MLFIVLVDLVVAVVGVADIVVIAVFLERLAFVLIGPHKG